MTAGGCGRHWGRIPAPAQAGCEPRRAARSARRAARPGACTERAAYSQLFFCCHNVLPAVALASVQASPRTGPLREPREQPRTRGLCGCVPRGRFAAARSLLAGGGSAFCARPPGAPSGGRAPYRAPVEGRHPDGGWKAARGARKRTAWRQEPAAAGVHFFSSSAAALPPCARRACLRAPRSPISPWPVRCRRCDPPRQG